MRYMLAFVSEKLHRVADRKRCRYADCIEQHPVAGDDEKVTCPKCRHWMGLPALKASQ